MINIHSFTRALIALLMAVAFVGVAASPLPLETLDSFDFEDQDLGAIGYGGAEEGQPQSRSSTDVTATVIDDGGGGQALEVDNAGTSSEWLVFQWTDNQNLNSGLVQMRFTLTLPTLDKYRINVRRAGGAADNYATLLLDQFGNIRISRASGTVTLDSYSAGDTLDFVLDFNMEADTLRIRINGTVAEDYTAYSPTSGLGIGRIMFGWSIGSNGDRFELDDVEVRQLAPLLNILDANFDDKTLGEPSETGGASAGEPVTIATELDTEIVSAGSGDRALEVTRASSGGSPLVEWEFLDDTKVDTGSVVADFEITMKDASYLLVRLTDADGDELVRVSTQPTTNPINVRFPDDIFFGTEIGNYTVDTPFRLRLSCQMDDRVCSVAIDDDWVVVERDFASTTASDFAVASLRTGFTALSSVDDAFVINDLTVEVDPIAGVPSAASFEQQPSDVARLDPIAPTVAVSVVDAFDDPVADGTLVTLETDAGFEIVGLSGNTATTVDGVASFPDLSADFAVADLQIVAQVDHPIGAPTATSLPFDVLRGRPAVMSYIDQPSDTLIDQPMATPVRIQVRDAGDEPPAAGLEAVLVVAEGPDGAILSDNTASTDAAGRATFPDLTLDSAGEYRLSVTMDDEDFAGELSASFTVSVPQPASAVFDVQPSETVVLNSISPAVKVNVIDELGDPAADDTAVTLTIHAGPPATLAGASATTTAGQAVFDTLSIDQLGTFQLRAEVAGMPASGEPVSVEFQVVAGAASTIEFEDQPTATTAGELIDPPVAVRVQDENGFDVADGESVSLDIASGPAGGVLLGETSASTLNGIAAFDDLRINVAGDYVLSASLDSGLSTASNGFAIQPGPPAAIVIDQQPTATVVGGVIAPPVRVRLVDEAGNTVPDGQAVRLEIAAGPSLAELSGTLTRETVDGVATFDDLSLDQPDSGYRLIVIVEDARTKPTDR